MASIELGVRTWTDLRMTYTYASGGSIVTASAGVVARPNNVELNPGLSVERLAEIGDDGVLSSSLKYPNDRQPTLAVTFPTISSDLEQFIHGKVNSNSLTSQEIPVHFEQTLAATTVAAVTSGNYGFEVAEQTVGASNARYYKFSRFGEAVELTLVDFTTGPTGNDEYAVGANFAHKFSSNLVGEEIRGLIPDVVYPTVSGMTSTDVITVGISVNGISFDGNYLRTLVANRCSPNFGVGITSAPERTIPFEILTDETDPCGLPYQIYSLPVVRACAA